LICHCAVKLDPAWFVGYFLYGTVSGSELGFYEQLFQIKAVTVLNSEEKKLSE